MPGRVGRWLSKLKLASWNVEFSLFVIPLAVLSYHLINMDIGGGPPHRFSEHACLGCHFTVPKLGGNGPHRFTASIDILCIRCHKDIGAVSHVVNVAPEFRTPDKLPLDDKGNITCSTCHDPHMPYKNMATGRKTYFLRGSGTGRWSCAACMSAGQGTAHLKFMSRAHWRPSFKLFSGFDREPGCRPASPEGLDSLSLECLGCHDTSGWVGRANSCAMVFVAGGVGGGTHPIGMDYYKAARVDKELRYNDLDTRVKLFDGRMGCCTCHDPYLAGNSGLRIGSADDTRELCRACHTKLGG